MNRMFFPLGMRLPLKPTANTSHKKSFRRLGLTCAAMALVASVVAAQVITIDTSGKATVSANGPVDRRFAQITPRMSSFQKLR